MSPDRRLPIGAEIREGASHFRVWAPRHSRVDVVLETGRACGEHVLEAEARGYFSGLVSSVAAGDLYRFRLGGDGLFPDPASRFQPQGPHCPSQLVDPADPVAFERCELDHRERETNAKVYNLHKDLLALRMSEPAFRDQQPRGMDGAVLGSQAFVLRFFAGGQSDRLLLVNLGTDLLLNRAAEPLLAPPDACGWKVLWSSEDQRYGGEGTAPVETLDGWRLMGEAAVVLAPEPLSAEEFAQSWERANAAMKARKHRERTRLME